MFQQEWILKIQDYVTLRTHPLLCLQQSLAEIQQVRAKALASPTQDSPGYLLKDSGGGGGGSSSKNSSCDTDDFVMVPAHFPSKPARTLSCQLLYFLSSFSFKEHCYRPVKSGISGYLSSFFPLSFQVSLPVTYRQERFSRTV